MKSSRSKHVTDTGLRYVFLFDDIYHRIETMPDVFVN